MSVKVNEGIAGAIVLDERDAAGVLDDLMRQRPGYVPEWLSPQGGIGAALPQIVARYAQTIIQRLNQAPVKNGLALLDTLGVRLIPAQSARVPIIFTLAEDAADVRMPAGARVAAPPPPERNDQIIFETERATGLTSAKLTQAVSLWPGRDQYLDHSTFLAVGTPLPLFRKRDLIDTTHAIYIAHDTLLALAGKVTVDVIIELRTPSTEHLDIIWEYWDGKVWREFLTMRAECDDQEAQKLDSTLGLQRSGRFRLKSDCAETSKKNINGIESYWIRGRLNEPLPPNPAQVLPEVESVRLSIIIERALPPYVSPTEANTDASKTMGARSSNDLGVGQDQISGLLPDKAFSDVLALDLTKPFYPFGVQPQPGTIYSFSSEEVFSKPRAQVTIATARVCTAQDKVVSNLGKGTPLEPVIVWEYWNGTRWNSLLPISARTDAGAEAANTIPWDPKDEDKDVRQIEFEVPNDIARTKVNDQDGLWVRAKFVSGGFGYLNEITITGDGNFSYIVPVPPVLGSFKLGYGWQYGPFPAERVLTYNDFHYEDHTAEARYPGNSFQPFTPVRDITPALYLGFDKKLPVDRLGIFFDIVEQRGDVDGPPLIWQYWDGFEWKDLVIEDETRSLRLPGMVSLIGPADARELDRFDLGKSLFWLRARLKEDGAPGEPVVNAIYHNAVWATQRQTIVDEPIGASTGEPNQAFAFRQIPVVDGEIVEVRELGGLRANLEWRMVAMELFGDERIVRQLEADVARQSTQAEVQHGDLRLMRNRDKRVTEVWVRWYDQPHLFFSSANDRSYAVDRATGRIFFGDNINGRVPPSGAAILARRYQSGGGAVGNLPARTVTQMLGPLGGIQSVFNPRPAEGGADGETAQRVAQRGPCTLRHRGRALAPQDYETLAKEANANVAVARCVPCFDTGGRVRAGWVTLVIIPYSKEAQPWPSFGLRQHVQRFITERAPTDIVVGDQIYVTGPDYIEVEIEATLIPQDASTAGSVDASVREALQRFLHPLYGGPDGQGWEPGRDVYVSDIATTIEHVIGVDHATDIQLYVDSQLQGERIDVRSDRVVSAGQIRLKLVEGVT